MRAALVALALLALAASGGSVSGTDTAPAGVAVRSGSFDTDAWQQRADARVVQTTFAVPAGTDTYRLRLDADGRVLGVTGLASRGFVSPSPAAPDAAAPILPGGELALCVPTGTGLHYTTTPDALPDCPFTWHDGPIRETVLVCAVAGDCTLAGQDAPTGGTFWVICHGRAESVHAWGVAPAASVQCNAGTIGPTPQHWTHWTSWCRVFGVADGTAACAHGYG